MSSIQPPRPGGMGGPPRPGGVSGSAAQVPQPRGGGSRPPQPKVYAPSPRILLFVFLLLVFIACIAVYLTPSPFTHLDISLGSVVGGLLGLFGCTFTFGMYRFIVDQQYEAGNFSEWNFPISRGRMAEFVTVIGWIAGAINCYLIAYELARKLVS